MGLVREKGISLTHLLRIHFLILVASASLDMRICAESFAPCYDMFGEYSWDASSFLRENRGRVDLEESSGG